MHEEVFNRKSTKFIPPQKTLIVFPDYIGDSVLLTAFLRNYRYNLPENSVVHVCANKSIAAMLEGNSGIDAIFAKNKISNIKRFLQKRNYDAAIVLDFSLAWIFNILKSGIKQKVITDMQRMNISLHKFLGSLFTCVLKTTPIADKKPQIEVYLDFLSQLGLKIFDRQLEVKVDFSEINSCKKLIKDTSKRKIFLHLGASIYSKQWDNSHWKEVIEHLKDDEIYIIGSETPPAELLLPNVTNLCGKTSLKQTISLLYQADILITTDSAPAHLAAVAKVPNIIVLYGPTNFNQWKPHSPKSNVIQLHANVSCNPCNLRMCPHLKCLKELKPQMVIDAIKNINITYQGC